MHKRSWSWLWFILASLAIAIYVIQPETTAHWAIAITLMGPTVWLVFVGPSSLYHWQLNHRYAFVGWLMLAARIALFFFVLKVVAPRAISLLGKVLHG